MKLPNSNKSESINVLNIWRIENVLQSRRLLQGLIKQRETELNCDISTGEYQSSSGLLRHHEFTEIYMK